ncbi:MAG TPA: hypothetical protein PLO43_01050 [Chlamydiales bacterium]|nr:hypothetical protein [Chlamydiales bacterium]HPE84752.1 hypothetical protein [Chlamydiales bacterium]
MLARTRIIALLLFLGSASFLVYHICHITEADRSFYAKLSKNDSQTPQPLTEQKKWGVTKDAYYTSKAIRQHTHLAAQSSLLRATPTSKSYELVETLTGIQGTMVDGEQKRTFASKEGTYFFNQHAFITHKANVQVFRDKLLIDGIAKELRLHFDENGAHFQASQIKAHIPDTEELK